jgi:glycerophosphoryl diester phosphodiesterase
MITRLQNRGKRVHTYTINHPKDMEKVFKWGVNGIFTDDPPLAIRTLSQFQAANGSTK